MTDQWIEKSGITSSCCNVGFKKDNKPDLALILFPKLVKWAACFTNNRCIAAPLIYAKSLLNKKSRIKAVLINSGNANAATGKSGLADVKTISKTVSILTDATQDNVLMSSTGVIGVPLPVGRIEDCLSDLVKSCTKFDRNIAYAITTTDTKIKTEEITFESNGKKFHIWAMAKGSGMIEPHLATMLVFIITDFDSPENDMSILLKSSVDRSFNIISVDGDMSTNDSIFLFSTGEKGGNNNDFKIALDEVTKNLSLKVVSDGEGATKLVNIAVVSANTDYDAELAARKVADSPLVRTAIFGEDPNWGRVYAAVGASGAVFDPLKVDIMFNNYIACKNGIKYKNYDEDRLASVMRLSKFTITINLGAGNSAYNIYTADLSYKYVEINASYRS